VASIHPAPTRFTTARLAALALVLLFQPAGAPAQDAARPREAQERDLFSVITLAGQHCGAIVGVVENGASDYSVQCRNGKRFRVHSTGDSLQVTDETPGVTPTPSTGQDHHAPGDHRASVAKSLFAIVNLSGKECDEVTRFERGPHLQYRVWCRNHTSYRISVRSGGRLEVAKLPGD
jgi:hypothetical protein